MTKLTNLILALVLAFVSTSAHGAVISTKFLPVNTANGVAGLDGSGKIGVGLLPAATMIYKGAWNANTNSPALADSGCDASKNGNIYRVSTAGSQDLGSGSITFYVGDFVICSSSVPAWQRSPAADGVISVNSMTGAVTITASDVGLGNVTNDAQLKAADLDTSTSLGTSDTKVPSQAAVKSYVDSGLSGKQASLGFTPEDVANKSTSTSLGTSNTLYPTQGAVKSYVDTGLAGKQASLGFTPEDVSNKSTSTSLGTSDTLYPSQNAVKSYVDTAVGAIPAAKTWLHQDITLVSDDITAGYVDASQNCVTASVMLNVGGVMGALTDDYTLSTVSSKTRITFVATTGFGAGSPQALEAGDVIRLVCQY